MNCGAPITALRLSTDIYLKLTDYPRAVEVADEFIRRAPTNHDAHYLRGVAFEGVEDYRRSLADYSDAVELYGADKKSISSRVFLRMAGAYAALKQFCEATALINLWVALDPARRDTSQTRKIIADYESQCHCVASTGFRKESFPLREQKDVVTVKATINGVSGLFILDTGASYVSVKSTFAGRAKIPDTGTSEITLMTANGQTKTKLSRADKVALGKPEATNVPVAIQSADDKRRRRCRWPARHELPVAVRSSDGWRLHRNPHPPTEEVRLHRNAGHELASVADDKRHDPFRSHRRHPRPHAPPAHRTKPFCRSPVVGALLRQSRSQLGPLCTTETTPADQMVDACSKIIALKVFRGEQLATVPLQTRLEYGSAYLALAALLAVMTYDVHEMLRPMMRWRP